jgi:hypothetical protein
MQVRLIRSPEYRSEKFNNVISFLQSFKGDLVFTALDIEFEKEKFPFLKKFRSNFNFLYGHEAKDKIIYNPSLPLPSSFKELFSLCDEARFLENIRADEFVILLTERRNDLNWFSNYQGRNVFVHTGDWELYFDNDDVFPIAYEVIENLMESLMKIDTSIIPNINVHQEPIGCMNDFCQNKEQVKFKIRTAYICPDCLNTIKLQNISQGILNQALKIFDSIREGVLDRNGLQSTELTTQSVIRKIVVDQNGSISIPDLKIIFPFTPVYKTLYIFFLKHQEGVNVTELSIHEVELKEIYGMISQKDMSAIQNTISNLVNAFGESFNQTKAKINNIIGKSLPPETADLYKISGVRNGRYKINVSEDLIDMQF